MSWRTAHVEAGTPLAAARRGSRAPQYSRTAFLRSPRTSEAWTKQATRCGWRRFQRTLLTSAGVAAAEPQQ
jgi:hypothetical protein